MHGQDRLQSVKPPAMVLLLLSLPVAHADREKKVHILVVCMLLFLIGFSSTYIVSPRPHPALRSRLTPVRADGYSRACWHILWTRPGPHLCAPSPHSRPLCMPRSCPTLEGPHDPHGLPIRPGPHLRAPRPHSRHTKQVALLIWRSPPSHLPQNALWVLLRGVL